MAFQQPLTVAGGQIFSLTQHVWQLLDKSSSPPPPPPPSIRLQEAF